MKEYLKIGGIVVLIVAIVVAAPLVVIWSLNTLFPVLAIPYGISTWLATYILAATFGNNFLTFKKKL
jgi:hypothetical protein